MKKLCALLCGILTYCIFLTGARAEGFNCTFDTDAPGWEAVNGTWAVSGGIYASTGFYSGRWTSTAYNTKYTNFEYTVKMRRVGNSEGDSYPNGIFIRGGGNYLSTDTDYDWISGYSLRYKNNGSVAVVKKNGYQTTDYLLDWASMPDTLATQDGWQILKAVAKGTKLEFYVNDKLVWSGEDSTFKDGYVGVGCYRDIWNNTCEMDSASLVVSSSGGGSDKYTISGYIKDSKKKPVSGVKVSFAKVGRTYTNSKGYYSMSVSSGYSGTATPSKKGRRFSPSKRVYKKVKKNFSKQNYTAL